MCKILLTRNIVLLLKSNNTTDAHLDLKQSKPANKNYSQLPLVNPQYELDHRNVTLKASS